MSHSIWKLVALAVIVGLAGLVCVEAQKRLNLVAQQQNDGQEKEDATADAGDDKDQRDVEIVKSQPSPTASLDLFDEEVDGRSSKRAPRSAGPSRRTLPPTRSILDEPLGDLEEITPANEKIERLGARTSSSEAAPIREADTTRRPLPKVVVPLDGDLPDPDEPAEPVAEESPPAKGPRLLKGDEASPKVKPLANQVADPFAEDEMPTIERAPPRRPSAAPALPPTEPDDDLGDLLLELEESKPTGNAAKGEGDRPAKLAPLEPQKLRAIPELRPTEAPERGNSSRIIEDEPASRAAPEPVAKPSVPRRKPQPKVTIEKEAPTEAILGKPMVYRIVVKNTGSAPARQVVVEDAVPDAVKVDGSIPQALLDRKRLVWKLGTLEAGEERTIQVRVIPQSEGTLGSVATVNFASEPAGAPVPKLKFELVAPAQVVAGSPVALRFRVQNISDIDARNVVVRNVLPAGLRHPDGDDLEYPVGTLPAGKTCEVELTLTAAQPGRIVNRALVTAQGNVTEEAQAAFEVIGPALQVSRTGPKQVFPGKAATYANTVLNPGPSTAVTVQVVETVPQGMEFVAASDGGRFDAAKRTVTWALDRLAAQESKTVNVTLNATARGAQVSVVRAWDVAGASGESVRTTHISGVAALTIEVGELAPHVEVGEEIKVPIRVLNRGSDLATNIRTTITLPPGLELISAKGPVEYRIGTEDATSGKSASRGTGDPAPASKVLRFAPVAQLDSRGDVTIEVVLGARRIGSARVRVEVQCDQISEPVSREETTTVAATGG